jgi:hypothetical protein
MRKAHCPSIAVHGKRALADQLRDFVVAQADKLTALASDAVKISAAYLQNALAL